MRLTLITSDRGAVAAALARGTTGSVCPEGRWRHPATRAAEVARIIRKGGDIALVTWDEVTFNQALAASYAGAADVEVVYLHENGGETRLRAEDGSLPSWPDPDGFFPVRKEIIFGGWSALEDE